MTVSVTPTKVGSFSTDATGGVTFTFTDQRTMQAMAFAANVASGVASLTVTTLTDDNYTMSVGYNANGNFQASPTVTKTLTANDDDAGSGDDQPGGDANLSFSVS